MVYSNSATTVNSCNEDIASLCGERKVSVYFSPGWCMLQIFVAGLWPTLCSYIDLESL